MHSTKKFPMHAKICFEISHQESVSSLDLLITEGFFYKKNKYIISLKNTAQHLQVLCFLFSTKNTKHIISYFNTPQAGHLIFHAELGTEMKKQPFMSNFSKKDTN